LGVDPEGCAPAVSFCPTCAAAYMNSFKREAARQDGREGPAEVWTIESYLKSYLASLAEAGQ
jgi:hypothetical protein